MSEYGAANDPLPPIRSLTPHDVTETLRPNAFFWASILEMAVKMGWGLADVDLAYDVIFRESPDLQREVAWRGTWLDREVIDAMDATTLRLIILEIYNQCVRTGNARRCAAAAVKILRPYSPTLQARAA